MRFRALFIVAALLLITAPVAHAQQASIQGSVQDSSQATLPGVTVTAVETATGRRSTTVTDMDGRYRFDTLPPGLYLIRLELSGFATVELPDLELLVGTSQTMAAVEMSVASLSETIVVRNEAPLVDTMSSQVAGNIDRRQMEQLPLQGRNWQDLSLLVKGITANSAGNRPGVQSDDQFQLNLDGQQITQRVAGSGFGQPKLSREAIAEFQIVTTLFDITQGRSTGMQVQAISRSGTNDLHGSYYGFFRSDRFNAADPVAGEVLPFSNQQTGGTIGGPIIQSRTHYFASYEYERQPSTAVLQPTWLPGQDFAFETRSTDRVLLARVDHQINDTNRLTVRGQRWDYDNPFDIGSGTAHPSRAEQLTQSATNVFASWTRTLGRAVVELRGGYNGFSWKNDAIAAMGSTGTPADTPEYSFPGLTLGGQYNYPNYTWQDTYSGRLDVNWVGGSHQVKGGIEYLGVHDTKEWSLGRRGRYVFSSRPSVEELERRFPADAWDDPSRWDVSGLEPHLQRFDQNFHPDYLIDIPRPTLAMWIADTWRISSALSVNVGVRWDADWGATDPPGVAESVIMIDNGFESGDFGYKSGIRDLNNIAPRAGFAYNVGSGNSLVIRGGSGLYYNTPVSNVTYSHQFYSQSVAASFAPDGQAGFIEDPRRGATAEDILSGAVPVPQQAGRIISPDFVMPYTWQSSLGFQKQMGATMSVEADLTHWKWYNDTRTRDVNLFYDPETGYSKDPRTFGRPNPDYAQINWFESTGTQDYLGLSTAFTRRFRNNFQAGATYTVLFYQHDDGSIGYNAGTSDNPFNPLAGEWARSTAFQRHTARFHGTVQLPYGVSLSGIYLYGSGNYFGTTVSSVPFGKPGTNRLNMGAPIVIAPDLLDRFEGPSVIGTGEVVPRNALRGLPLHKVDLRLSKTIPLGGSLRGTLMAEVFNVFNHRNYGGYVGAIDSPRFGEPTASSGSAYTPRSGQLGFRIEF